MKLLVTARARGDLDTIFDYLNARSPQAAQNVMRAIQAAADVVTYYPDASPATSIPGVRSKFVPRYGYIIFYRTVAEAVVLLHVRHGARAMPTTFDD